MEIIFSRFKKLFSMVEATKMNVFLIVLIVLTLSSLEILSLAFIGIYLGFIVDPESIMNNLHSFNPLLASSLKENISLSNQYILFGCALVGIFLIKIIFVLSANFYIFKFSINQQLLMQEKLMGRYINQNYESYIQSNS